MRLERERSGRSQLRGSVVPHLVQQLGGGAQATVERVDQPPFALEPVLEVLAQLRLRIPHHRAVPGAEGIELQRLQATQRIEVGGQRAAARRDEHAAFAEHRVAAEHDPAGQQRDMVGGVARRLDHLERAEPVTVLAARRPARGRAATAPRTRLAQAAVRAATGAPERSRSSGTACEWSRWLCVSTMPAIPPRSCAACHTRSTCAGSAGPGSITHAGAPISHVFVPESVIGPAFAARTSVTPVRHALCDVAPRGQYAATGRF